jgi:transcriptional regulator with PAS, ATPase and Fis domain/tetratricopeptide (TPR) repeat protein
MQHKGPSVNRFERITELKDVGLFRDALKALDSATPDLLGRAAAQILKAELLERIGRRGDSEALIQRALRSRSLSAADRILADLVLGRIRIETGDVDDAVAHLNRCVATARRLGDVEQVGFAQLKLLTLLSDGVGPDATAPLFAEVRALAMRSGSPRLLCAVHIYFGQIEALRGSVISANRHLRAAARILKTSANLWLESVLENVRLAVAIMECDFDLAERCALRGRELTEQTGGAAEYVVNLGNSGFLYYMLGRFDEALACYEQVLPLLVPGSHNYSGTLDSLARIKLVQGRLEECDALLHKIDDLARTERDKETYVYRHAQLTRAHLEMHRQNFDKARKSLTFATNVAKQASDRLLNASALLSQTLFAVKTQASTQLSRRLLGSAAASLGTLPPHISGLFEYTATAVCSSEADLASAAEHGKRAERIFAALKTDAAAIVLGTADYVGDRDPNSPSAFVACGQLLQSVVLMLRHAKHTDLMARELAYSLWSTGSVQGVKSFILLPSGQQELTQAHGSEFSVDEVDVIRLEVEDVTDRRIELIVKPKLDANALITIEAAREFIELAKQLAVAVEEKNERTSIWPKDDLASFDSKAVVSGHMREQMILAERVARTTVTVLITGESGTGKEILARAIHDFSDRARKPFVPLNCAAVPRDLLESQLFGHRRGAFTGAERDHLGVVRAAAGGTLFLDEIGELSLELQPKLLRFLESGEISPLGEPAPLSVNVRVIAATNTNLEDAVRDGKFREDLFYRLNVVRLSLRPLRERRDEIPGLVTRFVEAAAREYNKGHLEVADETLEHLLLYRWPGNVRQLHNEIRRMVALAEPNSTLPPEAISADILGAMPQLRHPPVNGREISVPLQQKLLPTLSRIEYEMIKAALRDNHGRLEPAAKALGISRKGLYLKRQRLGL